MAKVLSKSYHSQGGGNCQFGSVSTAIGIFQSATKLREATVHYLTENNLIHRMPFEFLANVPWLVTIYLRNKCGWDI